MPRFPLPLNRDGSCSKLVGNECSIYEDRPAMCRTGYLAQTIGAGDAEYLRLAAAACNRMQEADGMGGGWRVNLG